MAKQNDAEYRGAVNLVLMIILAVLVLYVISEVFSMVFGSFIARIITAIVLILGILWLLGKDGQTKIKRILNQA